MSASPAPGKGCVSAGALTYEGLIADVRKRASNTTHLTYLPDATALTFNNDSIDSSFPLLGATKQGMLVGHYDTNRDGKTEAVYAYGHNHVAHRGKHTTSISYFLFKSNRQLTDAEQDYIDFIKPFNCAYNLPGSIFLQRVRLLILFYFMEKGLLERLDPLTDDVKQFKSALASVAKVGQSNREKPPRDAVTLRAPGVPPVPRNTPFTFKVETKDDEPEFLASVEKAPGATLSIVPGQKTPKKNATPKKDTAGANLSRPVDLTESDKTALRLYNRAGLRTGGRSASTSDKISPFVTNDNAGLSEQGKKRTRQPVVLDDDEEEIERASKRPILDEGLTHFQAFVQHIRGKFTEEDHLKLQAENARLKDDIVNLKQEIESEKKNWEVKMAAEVESRKAVEADRDAVKMENESLKDLKGCIVDMAEQIKEGEKVKEIEMLMEVERLREVERLKGAKSVENALKEGGGQPVVERGS